MRVHLPAGAREFADGDFLLSWHDRLAHRWPSRLLHRALCAVEGHQPVAACPNPFHDECSVCWKRLPYSAMRSHESEDLDLVDELRPVTVVPIEEEE